MKRLNRKAGRDRDQFQVAHKLECPASLLLAKSAVGAAIARSLGILGFTIVIKDVRSLQAVQSVDGCLKDNGILVDTILVDPSHEDYRLFYERCRLEGCRTPILQISSEPYIRAQEFLVEYWDNRLVSLVQYCIESRPISFEDFIKRCRPYLELRLCHDLPKLIEKPESESGRAIQDFRDAIKHRLVGHRLLGLYVKHYLSRFSKESDGLIALKRLIWGDS